MFNVGDVVIYEDEKYIIEKIYYELGRAAYLKVSNLNMLLFVDEVELSYEN